MPPVAVICAAESADNAVKAAANGTGQAGLRKLHDSIAQAEPIINKAFNRINEYGERVKAGAQFGLTVLEITKWAAFAVAGACMGAVLMPVAAGAVAAAGLTGTGATMATGALATGVSSMWVAGMSETYGQIGEVSAGLREDFDISELAQAVAIAGATGALTGAVGTVVAARVAPVIAKLLPSSSKVTQETIKRTLTGSFKGTFSTILNDTVKAVANPESMKTEQFLEDLGVNLIRGGLLGATIYQPV